MKHLSDLDFPLRLAISMFLVVLTSGFAVSELYLMHTTEMADGKPGLSLDDITFQFHGSGEARLAMQVRGPMKKYFTESEDESKLKSEELADIEKIVAWCQKGAPRDEYESDDKEKNKTLVANILFQHGCVDCHEPGATMKGNKHDSPLDCFEHVCKFTKPDTGMDAGRLLSLSHIHLLGMGMMFLLVGVAVALTRFPSRLRAILVFCGPLAILLDIFGWWGVKWYGATVSPMVMFSGALMFGTFVFSVVLSLYDLWLRKPHVHTHHEAHEATA